MRAVCNDTFSTGVTQFTKTCYCDNKADKDKTTPDGEIKYCDIFQRLHQTLQPNASQHIKLRAWTSYKILSPNGRKIVGKIVHWVGRKLPSLRTARTSPKRSILPHWWRFWIHRHENISTNSRPQRALPVINYGLTLQTCRSSTWLLWLLKQ